LRNCASAAARCISHAHDRRRDLLLSGTVNLHRAYLEAGVDARLVVFDALAHAFWYDSTLPEAIEANKMMADFFVKQLRK
jgi:acetyl esterase/lipase